MTNGTTPITASNSRVTRHRLNRGDNRHINKVLHTAALTQITRPGTQERIHYDKCTTRSKTKREALKCLKRRIPQPRPQTPPTKPQTTKTSPKVDIETHRRAARYSSPPSKGPVLPADGRLRPIRPPPHSRTRSGGHLAWPPLCGEVTSPA